MSVHPSLPLTDRLAGLRTAAQADAARSWLSNSLQTLIMSIFARIFGRLEQLLLLWQSGHLPPLKSVIARPTSAPRPAIPAQHLAQPRARPTRQYAAIPDLAARAAIARRAPALRAHHAAPRLASSRSLMPAARPRQAHDPPSARHPICRETLLAGVG